MIGKGTEIGEHTVIKKSVIGTDCFIENYCEITNCIIWDGVTVKSGSVLTNVLVCDNVTINIDCIIRDGVMLDKNVEVKEGLTLEKNMLASCLEVRSDSKGNVSFLETKDVNEDFFE